MSDENVRRSSPALFTALRAAGITEGFVLVSAMHISASVFVNDHESGLWKDILDWLEHRIAPWDPEHYRHNSGTEAVSPCSESVSARRSC